jgi:hypothetical protein
MKEIVIKINRHDQFEQYRTDATMLISKWAPVETQIPPEVSHAFPPTPTYGQWYCEHPLVGKSYTGPYYVRSNLKLWGRTWEEQILSNGQPIRNPVAFFLDRFDSGGLTAPFLVLDEFDLHVLRDDDWFSTGSFKFTYASSRVTQFDVIWKYP